MSWSDRHSTTQERLEQKRKIDSETGCWLWQGFVDSRGHGRIRPEGERSQYVHRVAMRIYKGFDPKSSKLICHIRECPNANCFNPEHLYIGTQQQNVADAIALGHRTDVGWSAVHKKRKRAMR